MNTCANIAPSLLTTAKNLSVCLQVLGCVPQRKSSDACSRLSVKRFFFVPLIFNHVILSLFPADIYCGDLLSP